VDKCRSVLASHNIGMDDKVAMISDNRVEWAVIYFAANSLGAQIIPMYQVQAEKDWKYIVEDSGAKLLITATEPIYEKTKSYINSVGNLQSILCFDADEEYLHSYKNWMKQAKEGGEASKVPAVTPTLDDLTTIIYTSGTTGNPKGVNLSHRYAYIYNICLYDII
jgi:long-chain acyl-CoA synthetase